MAPRPVYILGGFQTDFARNWTKEGKHISAMIREAVQGGLAATQIDAAEVEVGHVGNFAAELYAMQGHLGAFLVDADPALSVGYRRDATRRPVLLGPSRCSPPVRRSKPSATTCRWWSAWSR